MAEERVRRRLAAIAVLDVVGYSRLMEADEAGTLAALKERRTTILQPTVRRHSGRVVKVMGDGVLLEFASAVNAVNAAIELQSKMMEANADLPEARRIVLRIGINLSDVLIEGSDLYGDGINVAARLESLAGPGEIFVSPSVHDQVNRKLAFGFDDLGQMALKNIAEPMRVYRVRIGRAAMDREEGIPIAIPLSVKPSIAVLPFTNIGGEPEQEYFADGVVEDIITALSRFKNFAVAARNSSFTYKNRAIDVRTAAKELGVKYVLEGSVRRRGQQIRVTAQLNEAQAGMHLWADRFDGDFANLFDFQDLITEAIVGILEPEIQKVEIERARRKRPENLDAYDLYLRALPHLHESTRESCVSAIDLLEQAIALDPDFALAAAYAAWAYEKQDTFGLPPLTEALRSRCLDLAHSALKLDGGDPHVSSVCALALLVIGSERELSLAVLRRAVEGNPNSSFVIGLDAFCNTVGGDLDRGLAGYHRALQLSPRGLDAYANMSGIGYAHFFKCDFTLAIEWLVRSRAVKADWPPIHWTLAAAYAHLDRMQEAHESLTALYAISPGIILHDMQRIARRFDKRFDLIVEGLRKAGLQD